MTLPAGATVYSKRPVPSQPDGLPDFLTRELGIAERAIRDVRLTPIRSLTAAFTLTDADGFALADATAGAFTITLPDVRRFWGRTFGVKKVDASVNAVTVASSALIDGAATYAITVQYEAHDFVSDGTTWWVR